MIGETISHYRILERLGRGGMGEVYKAEDLRLQRLVALKLMLEEAQTNNSKQRFVREARAASALNHPNIATVYEIDEVEREGSLYSFIAMEYVEGRTLKDFTERFTIGEAVDIAMQIAAGLAEAHARGIVHRDIKPSNVMLNGARRVKLLDFGVAKYQPVRSDNAITESLYQSDILKTAPGLVIGTFAYMSPEQALGHDVDQRGDIFSLGVLFYELLAGRHPFDGRTTLALVDSILHADPRPLLSFNSQVTPEVEAISRRMLAKDREQRYPTAADVLRDLEKVKRDITANEADPYQTSRALPTGGSDPSGGGRFTSGTVSGKSLAVMNFANITKDDSDDWLGVGIAETVTADLKRIEGISVIGRERVYEVTRRLNISTGADFDTTLATTIGREVAARWIICGGYQRVGETVRITARYVDVTTGEVVRTVKIDGPMSEIFKLQDKIVYELSRGLDFKLKSGELDEIGKHETSVIEAYETFTRGMIELRALSKDAIDRAIELFRKAIQLDPKYARVYAMLGYTLGMKGSSLSQRHLTEEAVALLQKAIELAPSSAESYAALGLQFISMNRIDEAIGAIQRALSFAPDDSTGRTALGRAYFLGKGMFREAAEQFEQALSSKPFSGWIALQLSQCYAYLGEFERGEEVAKMAVALEEQMESGQEALQIIGAYTRLGHIYALQDRFDDAIAQYYREIVFLRGLDHVLRERATIEVHSKLVSAYVRLGQMKDAQASFEILSSTFSELIAVGVDEPFTRYYVAAATAMMGKKEEALQLLEKAIEERRVFNVARARVDRDFDSLRSEPRFLALIEATG
jgi:serine/threonine protein kinase/tetratricopeptide (TPR) repeat protein